MSGNRIVGNRASDPRPTISAGGRVCKAEGCETVLSRYNADDLCGACGRRSSVVRKRKSPTPRIEPEDEDEDEDEEASFDPT